MKKFIKELKQNWGAYLVCMIYFSLPVIVIALVIIWIIAMVKYGSATIDNIPMWALWFLSKRG